MAFCRDVVGLAVIQEWPSSEGRGVLLSIEKATLELLDQQHAAWVDQMEVGRRVAGPIRFAIRVPEIDPAISAAAAAGAQILGGPVQTPWKDVNARLLGPDGTQITLFGAEENAT